MHPSLVSRQTLRSAGPGLVIPTTLHPSHTPSHPPHHNYHSTCAGNAISTTRFYVRPQSSSISSPTTPFASPPSRSPVLRRPFHTSLPNPHLYPPHILRRKRHGKQSPNPTPKEFKRILIVKKPKDVRTVKALKEIIDHLNKEHPLVEVFVEENSVDELKGAGYNVKPSPSLRSKKVKGKATVLPTEVEVESDTGSQLPNAPGRPGEFYQVVSKNEGALPHHEYDLPHPDPQVDLIITLGGDGTFLHVSSLFDTPGSVPPILSFSMGSLGFLLPFHIDNFVEAIASVFRNDYSLLQRMRLHCEIFDKHGKPKTDCPGTTANTGWQVLNEVALHRGRYPHLTVVDTYVNDQRLTEAVADGLILATPTGSTAYSLSSGGPITHPAVNCFLLTPIAPRSLSFRTLLLPNESEVILKISDRSRAPSELSVDGREVCILHPGEYVKVTQSAYPMPCVTRSEGEDDWVADINSLLQFNTGFKNKGLWRRDTTS